MARPVKALLQAGLYAAGLPLALLWRRWGGGWSRRFLVPGKAFAPEDAPPAPDYALRESWLARPDIAGNPALFRPIGAAEADGAGDEDTGAAQAALFFLSPTALYSRARWNAAIDDDAVRRRLARFARMQAAAFNGVAAIWMPLYRQATLGSFLVEGEESDKSEENGAEESARGALALAYGDVVRAFDHFLALQPPERPLFLAGHSQGALHLLRLLRDRRRALRGRLVAAYAVGWPVVPPGDLEAIGLAAATAPDDTGCILSWQSYAATGDLASAYAELAPVHDLQGAPVGERPMLCVNPLSGGGGAAPPSRNHGTLIGGRIIPGLVGARPDRRGLLLVAPEPWPHDPFQTPAGNYHIHDYALFFMNVREDAANRLRAFRARHERADHGR